MGQIVADRALPDRRLSGFDRRGVCDGSFLAWRNRPRTAATGDGDRRCPLAGERPSIWFWVLSIAGAIVVAAYALRGGDSDIVSGDSYLLIGVMLTGIGYTLSGILSRAIPGWEVISWALLLTFPFALVAAWIFWPTNEVHWTSWAGVVYGGIVVQFVAYACWNAALAFGGVARISQLQVLQPLFTIAIAALVLGEAIDLETVLFAVAIVIIVALSRRTTIRQRPGVAG